MNERSKQWAAGWTGFAGFTMIMLGCWWLIAGFAALFGDGELFVARGDWTFKMNAPTWGVIHMLLGVAMVGAGVGVFQGATWARAVGIIVAVIAGVLAFAWMPWFPVWAMMLIAVSVVVIWALTVYGHDMTQS